MFAFIAPRIVYCSNYYLLSAPKHQSNSVAGRKMEKGVGKKIRVAKVAICMAGSHSVTSLINYNSSDLRDYVSDS